jgi:hypothetical protein
MISLQFSYTLEDMQQAYRSFGKDRWMKQLPRICLVLFLLTICLIILFWLDPHWWVNYFTLVFFAFFVLRLSFAWRACTKLAKKIWKNTPAFRQPFWN